VGGTFESMAKASDDQGYSPSPPYTWRSYRQKRYPDQYSPPARAEKPDNQGAQTVRAYPKPLLTPSFRAENRTFRKSSGFSPGIIRLEHPRPESMAKASDEE